jgi:uncharacterized protein (DUF2235 family)
MCKNIILCADGTGNKGGHTPDSNVFKAYNAIDIHNASIRQITYYDNGVGTSTNKLLRAISGALGFGFQRNVRELYAFLSKNYHPEEDGVDADKVFMFGFSRGAATIRALNGIVYDCGLIDARNFNNDVELKEEVKTLVTSYLKARYIDDKCKDGNDGEKTLEKLRNGEQIEGCKSPRNKVKIEFIGVWDTVAALGMPKRTDIIILVSKVVNSLFNGIDRVFNFFLHHRNYNFKLTPNTTRACHALSIDDARTSFWPRIWNEFSEKTSHVKVDQVWFAGMHSDVGGGYPRQGMPNVPLAWILAEATHYGLVLNDQVLDDITAQSNVHGKIHDSRDGFGMFFRYQPRDIEVLSRDEHKPEEKILKSIKVHESVLSRMYYRTAGYAPSLLPPKFEVVNSAGEKVEDIDTSDDSDWKDNRSNLQKSVKFLKEVYLYQMLIVVVVLVSSIIAWNSEIDFQTRSGHWGHIADVLQYFLPDIFNNAIELWVYQQPSRFMSFLLLVFLWWLARNRFSTAIVTNALVQRTAVLRRYTGQIEQQTVIAPQKQYLIAFLFGMVFVFTTFTMLCYLLWTAYN